MKTRIESISPDYTRKIGTVLGTNLSGGEIIGITGELGAGKTCFIKGLADGLGITQSQYVRSPTFTLINEYSGRIPLYHFDLYRVNSTLEIEELGFEEYFFGTGVSAVEWFEKLKGLAPKKVLRLHMGIKGEQRRELYFSCDGVYYNRILKVLLANIPEGEE